MKTDQGSITRMALAVLAAAKLVLSMFGIEISQDLIDSIVDLVAALIVVYAAFKNNYLTRKGKAQAEHLDKAGLK